METGRNANKALTSTTGVGVSQSATGNQKIVLPTTGGVSTPGNSSYVGEDESIKTITGPGQGDTIPGGSGTQHKWGHTTPSGSRIELNDSNGAEVVELVHHTGASVVIEPDGSVYLTSTSSRGAGIAATLGDVSISSGGDIVIKGGASVSVDTPGDFTLNVGGTLFMKSAAMSIITGNLEETVDGSRSSSVKNDLSSVIGGIERVTVAGDSRRQVTGKTMIESGGDISISAGGAANFSSKGDMDVVSGSNAKFSSPGQTTVFAGGALKITGSEINASPKVDRADWADRADQANSAGSLGGSAGSAPSASAGSAGSLKAPQVMEAVDIVDTLTSERKYPEYPANAVLEHANAAGYGMISHDTSPSAEAVYNEYSGGNQGNINPSFAGETITTIPEDSPNRDPNIEPFDSNHPVPAPNNLNQKISKYWTLGQILNGTTTRERPSASRWNTIISRGVKLANNVLDPIKEKFPDVIVTSYYRSGSTNHGTGRAVDIVVHSRSTSKHAEIARFARDTLPVDQVFLEKNSSGRTHIHLRLSEGKGAPRVMTCGDKNCRSKTPGIDVAYLLRKGAPNT